MIIDFRHVEIEYELWAVSHVLSTLEPEIDRLSRQDEEETVEELKRSGWIRDDAEVAIALQDVAEKRDYVLPRLIRGPLVMSLWACYESSVVSVARTMREQLKLPLGLDDIRGESFLRRASTYYQAVLGFPLETDKDRYRRLADLYVVRNAFAHANGSREGMTPRGWQSLAQVLSRYGIPRDDDRGLVVPTRSFTEAAFDDVNDGLRGVVARARSR